MQHSLSVPVSVTRSRRSALPVTWSLRDSEAQPLPALQLKRVMVKLALVISSLLLAGAHAISSSGGSVLVLLEPKLKRDNYSLFFAGLQGAAATWSFNQSKLVPVALF